MKFNVLGREVEVQWKHLILVLIVKVGFELFSYFIQSAIAISQYQSEPIHYSLAGIESQSEPINYSLAGIESIFSSISLLLYGFIILWAADFIKGMKKDIALCRSFAGADFIAGLAFTLFWLALAILSLNPFFDEFRMFEELINKAFSFILSPILLYLWILILLEMNTEKIKSAAKLAAVFAIISPMLLEFYDFIVYFFYGEYSFYFVPVSIISALIGYFVFGFLLLYHIHDKELDLAAYLFAALYIGSGVFYIVLYVIQGISSGGIDLVYMNWITGMLISMGASTLTLGFLYLISRIRLDKRTIGK